MAQIPGSIPVTGFIAPTDSTDTYPVTDAIYGVDGYRSVSDKTERNNITLERRREGMLVYTQDTKDVWRLLEEPWSFNDSDWQLFISSGATSFLSGGTNNYTLSGSTDVNINSVVDGDYLVYNNGNWINLSETEIYFTATTDNQTYFVNQLPTQPYFPTRTECWVNGQKQRYGLTNDFVLSGVTNRDFVWNNNSFVLNTTDEINLIYL